MSKFLKALEQAERERVRALPEPRPEEEAAAVPASTVREGATVRVLGEPETPSVADAPVPVSARVESTEAPPDGIPGIEPHLVSLLSPDGFEAEQYRSLRTALELWREDRRSCVIGISSPVAADGKTTTAINLAATLTQGGATKVVLVEADLRNPMVGDDLGMRRDGRPGLVSRLRGEGHALADIVSRRPSFQFDVILAERRIASPYELLKSIHLKQLIVEGREQYDYVLIDTPPLVSFADCQVLANWIDGFLVVVAAHRTPRKLVEEALNVVGPEKVLGFVFNEDDRPLGGYGYYYSYPRRPSAKQRILDTLGGTQARRPKV